MPSTLQNIRPVADASPDAVRANARENRRFEEIVDGFQNHTAGEQRFNRLAYGGFAYLGVMAISIFTSWLLRDSHAFGPRYQKLVGAVQRGLRGSRSGEALAKFNQAVDSNMTIAAFFAGGTVASAIPIKQMEDHKAEIVETFDRQIYGRERVETDPQILEAHARLRAAPKQTWLSVMTSRLAAFAVTFGTSLLMGSQSSGFARLTGHSIDRDSAWLGRRLDRLLHAGNPEVVAQIARSAKASPNHILRHGPQADRVVSRLLSYIGLDAFYTAITAGTLYACTRLLAPFIGRNEGDQAPAAPPQAVPAEPATPSPSARSQPLHDAAVPGTAVTQAQVQGPAIGPSTPPVLGPG